jgi:hypothetical protein
MSTTFVLFSFRRKQGCTLLFSFLLSLLIQFTCSNVVAQGPFNTSSIANQSAWRKNKARTSIESNASPQITVTLEPELPYSPRILERSIYPGGTESTMDFDITNIGDASVEYTLEENSSWLELSTVTGDLPLGETDNVILTVSSVATVPGIYRDTILVVASAQGVILPVIKIAVRLTIWQDDAEHPGVSESSFSRYISQTEIAWDTITISNVGSAPMSFDLTELVPWLSIAPVAGNVPADSSVVVILTYDGSKVEISGEDTWVNTSIEVKTNDPDFPYVQGIYIDLGVYYVNRPPILNPFPIVSLDEGEQTLITFTARDQENDTLQISMATPLPYTALVDSGNGFATYKIAPPPGSAEGLEGGKIYYTEIKVMQSDGRFVAEVFSFTVFDPLKHYPVIHGVSDIYVRAGQTITLTVTSTDADSDNVTLWTHIGTPSFVTTEETGPGFITLKISPPLGVGPALFLANIAAQDQPPVSPWDYDVTQTIHIWVFSVDSAPPVIEEISPVYMQEGDLREVTLLARPGTNEPFNSVKVSLENPPYFIVGEPGDLGEATFTIVPGVGTAGYYNVTVVAQLAAGVTRAVLPIYISREGESNLPPVLATVPEVWLSEGGRSRLTLTATDEDGDDIAFTLLNNPGFVTLTSSSGGEAICNIAPSMGDKGYYAVDVVATDEHGLSHVAKLSIFVRANKPPIITQIGEQRVVEGDTLEVSLKASDPDGDVVEVRVRDVPDYIKLISSQDGMSIYEIIPSVGTAGWYFYDIIATDSFGNESQSTLALTIIPRNNTAPEIRLSYVTVKEGESKDFIVKAIDENRDYVEIYYESTIPEFVYQIEAEPGAAIFRAEPPSGSRGYYEFDIIAIDVWGYESKKAQRVRILPPSHINNANADAGITSLNVENPSEVESVNVFPVPVIDNLTIDFAGHNIDERVEIIIRNIYGELFYKGRSTVDELAMAPLSTQMLGMARGVYYVYMRCGHGIRSMTRFTKD